MLKDDLLRDNVDLSFETDLLYLDVVGRKVGVNLDVPVYDLDVNGTLRTTDLIVDNQANLDNLIINGPTATFTTSTGPINVRAAGHDPVIFHDRLTTAGLELNDNFIYSFSNQNIVLDPNGSGQINLLATTNVAGDLNITGNIVVNGNLSSARNIIIGDEPYHPTTGTGDTVTIAPDFTQDIIPGDDLSYDLGGSGDDSVPRRWAELWAPDWTNIVNPIADSILISEQTLIDGTIAKISTVQSNEDILINPDSGISYIESVKWEGNDITNLLNTPITFSSTGIGYYTIGGDNGFVVPSGDSSERPASPEVGATRWNTDEDYLEVYDGTTWVVSTGSGVEITVGIMEDLTNVYSLILG